MKTIDTSPSKSSSQELLTNIHTCYSGRNPCIEIAISVDISGGHIETVRGTEGIVEDPRKRATLIHTLLDRTVEEKSRISIIHHDEGER